MKSAPDIQIWRTPEALDGVEVAPDFTAVVRSARLRETMAAGLASGAVVISAVVDRVLCGYATIVPSSALEARWRDLADVSELGALEVARSARRRRIGTSLLAALGDALPLSSLVLMARGVVHHWDFTEADIHPIRYRRLLVGMLARVGFLPRRTDDPEIVEHPLNFLAVRFGERAASASLLAFAEREVPRG